MAVSRLLREAALERADGRCEWPPGCTYTRPRLETAHIEPARMGGSPLRDTLENVVCLCRAHHDWLDGRVTPNMRQFENRDLFKFALGRRNE